jgi:hypothetical protein
MAAFAARASGDEPRAPDLTATACAARGSVAARRGRPWAVGGRGGGKEERREGGGGEERRGWGGEEGDEVEMAIHFTPRARAELSFGRLAARAGAASPSSSFLARSPLRNQNPTPVAASFSQKNLGLSPWAQLHVMGQGRSDRDRPELFQLCFQTALIFE